MECLKWKLWKENRRIKKNGSDGTEIFNIFATLKINFFLMLTSKNERYHRSEKKCNWGDKLQNWYAVLLGVGFTQLELWICKKIDFA